VGGTEEELSLLEQNARHGLAREDFVREFERARQEQRVPHISGDATGLDLSGLDFSSEYTSPYGPHSGVFIGIDLRNAIMRHCRLVGSDFAGANLRGVDLTGSDLRSANLYSALLEGATLDEADLSDANLISAELNETGLKGTEFAGARFGCTSIHNCDLSTASGLAEVGHHEPSAIDSMTLRRSTNGLDGEAEYRRQDFFAFLGNAGLDDELLVVVRNWVGQPIEFHSIFLSHSSLDKEFARRLYRDLRSLGIRCWLDEKELLPGDSVLGEIDEGIRLWDRLLLVCSRNSLGPTTGWWVEEELERALAKEREMRRAGSPTSGTVIPITIDDYVFVNWDGRYRSTILERHVGDFRNQEEYPEALQRLVDALNKLIRP